MHDDHAARLQSGDGLADNLFAIIRSFPMEDMGKQDNVIGSFDFIFKIITGHEGNAMGQIEFSDHLFGERPGLRQVVDGGLELRIGQAEMNGIGSRSAAQVKQVMSVREVYFSDHPRRYPHGDVEHAHQKAFPPFIATKGGSCPERLSGFDGLIQMGPGFHQMVMVHDHETQIIRRILR